MGVVAGAMLVVLAGCGPNYSPNTYAGAAVQQANPTQRGVVVGVRQVGVSADATLGTVTGAAAGGIAGAGVDGGGGPITALSALGGSVIGGVVGGRGTCDRRHHGIRVYRAGDQGRPGLGDAAGYRAAGDRPEGAGDHRQAGPSGGRYHRDTAGAFPEDRGQGQAGGARWAAGRATDRLGVHRRPATGGRPFAPAGRAGAGLW